MTKTNDIAQAQISHQTADNDDIYTSPNNMTHRM